MAAILEQFDTIRVINLVDRPDRRREIEQQLKRLPPSDRDKVRFFEAKRPADAGNFPSLGARGCFESHLTILREALRDGAARLLIIEDDFDFAPDFARRGTEAMATLAGMSWDLFYGAPVFEANDERRLPNNNTGLISLPSDVPIMTTSCVGFGREALTKVEPFLHAMLGRPAGSPDFGPMHVDGAYSVFRTGHSLKTAVCWPPLGAQRASRSDIAPPRFLLDRFAPTRPLANRLRRLFR